MRTVFVEVSQSYNVYIEKGILSSCGEIIRGLTTGSKALIVSDSNVAPLYAERVKKSLADAGFETTLFTIEAGEASKSPENLIGAAECAIDAGLTRSDVFVALGGGVVTDLCGLCSALYQRGVEVVQIPTSLLAMVDASVGGKTAVNLSKGKNMFGVFKQPCAVICDSEVLATLPDKEFACGMAEVIKYAVLRGGILKTLLAYDINKNIDEIIEECVKIKRDYVCSDEFDKGQRQFLNLGHTVGHAIERVSGLAVSHGSAVAAGMCIVARACKETGICSEDTVKEIENLCRKFSLPTCTEFDYNDLYKATLSDKKREGAQVNVVMIKGIGDCYLYRTSTETLRDIIEKGDCKE